MTKLTKWFDDLLDAIQAMLMSVLVKLGPFFVALMPALFTAYAIFHTFKGEAGADLALFLACVVGLAFETVGIVACHTAIDLYNAKEAGQVQPVKFKLMAWLVPVYVVGVAAVVGFSQDAFTPLVKGIGIASPFLTAIVYIAVALARDLRRIEAEQNKTAEQRAKLERQERERRIEAERQAQAWEREKERLNLELRHNEKLARIEAKNHAQNERSNAQVGKQQNANLAQPVTQNGHSAPPLRVPKSEWRAQALEVLREDSRISGAELGRRLGASPRTGQNILGELETSGAIHKNGNGWEITR